VKGQRIEAEESQLGGLATSAGITKMPAKRCFCP